MIIGDMEIRLRADIARLQRDMDDARRVVGDATAGMARAAEIAKSALAGIAGGIGLSKIAELSDEYSKLTAQLRLATDSSRAYAQAYADVKRIANSSQTDLSATGSLYASLSRATKDLGISQKAVGEITESVNLALKVSGAGAQESAGAILQLSQAFASGALRGDEFNSVNEAAPRLMKALADNIGMPVGALRGMAEQGKLTAEVVATALPQALGQLRTEADQIQTISGAFTVLKNNVLEFTGVQAQASGIVTVLTGGIGLLANNLDLLAGVALTVGAAKLGSTFDAWARKTYEAVTASIAARAATVASMEATVADTSAKVAELGATQAMIVVAREEAVAKLAGANSNIAAARAAITAAEAAGAQSFALRTVRLATAELAVAEAQRSAMLAELAVLGRQQASVSTQITAALAAQTAAQAALNGATGAGTAAAGLASRALGLLGGPVGAIITLLGLAATAWSIWGRSAEDSSKQAAETYEEAHARIIKGLDEQIKKNERLIELQNQGMKKQDIDRNLPVLNQLKEAQQRLVSIESQSGEFAPGKKFKDDVTYATNIFFERQAVLKNIVELTEKMKKGDEVAAKAAAGDTEALFAVRQRLTGVNQQYLDDLAKLQAAYEKGAIGQQEYTTAVSKLATETYKNSAAGKDNAEATEMTIAAMKRRDQVAEVLTQREIARVAAVRAAGGMSEVDAINATAKAELAAFDRKASLVARETALTQKGTKERADLEGQAAELREQRRNRALQQEYELQAVERRARDELTKFNQDYSAGLEATSKILEKMVTDAQEEAEQNEETARTYGLSKAEIERLTVARLEDQLAQRASLGLTLDEIETLEKVIAAKKRTAAALGNMEEVDAQKQVWGSIKNTAHDTFVSIFDSGKSVLDRLTGTLQNGLLDLLYQMSLKKWIINIEAMATGGGTAGAASAAGSAAGSAGTSMLGAAAGSLFGAGGLTGSLMAGAGWLTGSTTLAGSLGAAGSLIGTGTAGGILSGIGMTAGALGPIALGVAGILAVVNKLDHSGTPHTGAAASASASGVQAINAGTLGLQRIDTSAAAQELTSQLASSVVAILDSTATTFGKTAGYTAATAFADDSSKDGAWGALIIQNMNGLVSQWGDANSKWAPSVFADGAQGQQQYLDAISKSTRAALDKIGLPSWAQKMLDDLGDAPALEDLAKTVDAVNATQKALAIMGERLVGFGRLSDDATSALLSAAGGIDALAANASAYYDAFYSDAEKTSVLSGQVADALQKVGLAMPATREAYRAQVEAQLALGAAGAPGAAALLGVASAIDQLLPKAEAVQDTLADVNKGYQDQIDELVKAALPAAQVREMEIAGMDASTVALYDRLAALKQEASDAEAAKQRAEAVASERLGLQEQLDQLTLSSTELLAQQRAALDESNRALFDQVQAAQAAKDAAEAAAAAIEKQVQTQNSLLDLQAQIAELTGDKAAAAAVLEQQHAIALAALDPALRGATEKLWALQAAAKATEQVKADATALLSGVDSNFSVLQKVIAREKAAVQASVDAHSASVAKLQSLSQSLRSTISSMQSPEQQLAARADGQAQIRAALAIARAGGALPDADSLKSALSAVQQDASDRFSNYTDYLRDLYETQNDIGALADITDDSLSVEQQALDAAKGQLSALSGMLDSAQQQIDVLKGISTTGLNIEQALQALAGSIRAAQGNQVVSAGSAINSAYAQYLGRAPDAAGQQWWQGQAAAGVPVSDITDAIRNSQEAQVQKLYQDLLGRTADAAGLDFFLKSGASMSQIASAIKTSDEYKLKVPGYANGGDFAGGVRAVGEAGIEIEATGPSRIHSTQSLMDALRNPSDNSAALAAAVDRLTATVERQNVVIKNQGDALDQIQRNTRRQADTLDVVTEGGTAIRTKGEK